MSAISALRPGHWIGIALIAALISTGAVSKGFGLLGGNAGKSKQLIACLDRRGINVGSLTSAVGNPLTLLSGAHAVDRAVKTGKMKQPEARAVLGCVQKVDR